MWDLGARIWDNGPVTSNNEPSERGSHTAATLSDAEKTSRPASATELSSDDESLNKDVQDGVHEVQAVATAWDMKSLIILYAFIYLIYTVDSLQQQITTVFNPYVTSSFSLHSLTATTGILANLLGGLARLPLAKILDVWGRGQGFAIMVFFLTIGIVMMAACNTVETHCAAQVFYWIGYTGISYVLAVVVSDTTSLKNRGLIFGLTSTPYIFTTWAGGPAAQNFLEGAGWRWGSAPLRSSRRWFVRRCCWSFG